MRIPGFALAVVAVSLVVFSGISCSSQRYEYGGKVYPSVEAALSAQAEEGQAILAEIEPAENKIGGSLVTILPTDAFLFNKWLRTAALSANYNDYLFRRFKYHLVLTVEGLKKRNLFDTVELRQAENPEEMPFSEDLALILPATKDAEWGLRIQKQDSRVPTPIRVAPEARPGVEWMTLWLTEIERVARNAREQ